MLRVLVILPFYGGSLPIGRYCADALTEIGCLVDIFEAPAFYSAFSALETLNLSFDKKDFLENSFLQVMSQAILAKVDSFKPDLVFCMAQAPMSRQALKKLKKDSIPTVMWFVEDYRLFSYWRAFAPYYDVFAVIQKEPFLSELTSIGVKHAIYLPLAAHLDIHKPLELSKADVAEFGSDVSFLGAGYPNRRRAFLEIVKNGVKIWGTEWENEPRLAPYLQRNGARISPQDAVKIYNATKINLNLHSSVVDDKTVVEGDFVNPRTFELAAAGAFQLVDKRSLLPELFSDDELATFTSLDELKEQIALYLRYPEKRQEIIEKSRSRVLQDHSYVQRMNELLGYIKKVVPGFGEAKIPDSLVSLSPDLKEDFISLLKELTLPLESSLSEVAFCIRKKQGKLSELEVAVLFLEEWKKQYCP